MSTMVYRNRLYFGWKRIAKRLDVGEDTAKDMHKKGAIRVWQSTSGRYYTTESCLNEDLGSLPERGW